MTARTSAVSTGHVDAADARPVNDCSATTAERRRVALAVRLAESRGLARGTVRPALAPAVPPVTTVVTVVVVRAALCGPRTTCRGNARCDGWLLRRSASRPSNGVLKSSPKSLPRRFLPPLRPLSVTVLTPVVKTAVIEAGAPVSVETVPLGGVLALAVRLALADDRHLRFVPMVEPVLGALAALHFGAVMTMAVTACGRTGEIMLAATGAGLAAGTSPPAARLTTATALAIGAAGALGTAQSLKRLVQRPALDDRRVLADQLGQIFRTPA